jgi:hypothetical protein
MPEQVQALSVSFIEGRLARIGEILQMLSEMMRQHSIGK